MALTATVILVQRSRQIDHEAAEALFNSRWQERYAHGKGAVERMFRGAYDGLVTIAQLPGVQKIDRYACGFTGDPELTVQQIYNNVAKQIDVSELYIVPGDMDPERLDPRTGKPQAPIATFDQLIVGRSEEAEESADGLAEEEIYEYREMRTQCAYFRANYPTRKSIKGLDYPAIVSKEVITCDNREFSRKDLAARNDAPRNGIVYSVPFYDEKGKFKGLISAVVRTRTVGRTLGSSYFALACGATDYLALPPNPAPETLRAFGSARAALPNEFAFTAGERLSVPAVMDMRLLAAVPMRVMAGSVEFSGIDRDSDGLLIFGVVVSGLLYWTVFALLNTRRRASSIAAEITQSLRESSERYREASVALRKSEERFELAVKGSQDGIWDWVLDRDELYYSSRFNVLLGFQDGELKPAFSEFESRLHPEDLDVVIGTIDAHLSRRSPLDVECRLRTRGGAYRWFRVRGQAVWDERGNALRVAGSLTDITDQKDSADQLMDYTHQLEQAAMHNEQQAVILQQQALELECARDDALASTRAKSEFLANMSHEIRTPMNGVIGMTGLLLDTELTGEQRDYALTIRNSADALLMLINDILDFSKVEAGKMTIEVVDFNLRQAIEEVADLLAAKAHERGLELNYILAPDFPEHLQGDPSRIRQIVTNLVGNAIKFTHEGEVTMKVRMLEETETHASFRFSCFDTGIGIPPDRLDAVFESFTQADGSSTRKYGGTGLGLTICRQLAELMGGRIGVNSDEGKGSEFWFELNLEKSKDVTKRDLPYSLEGLRVLIVDDNGTNRLILREQLKSWKCVPTEADSGRAALDLLASVSEPDRFQMILTDMQMPEMDGEQLAHEIRAMQPFADTPILLLSSLGSNLSAAEVKEKGFAAYLPKPVRQSQLYNALVQVIGVPKEEDRRSAPREHGSREPVLSGTRILLAEDNAINQKVALRMLEKLGCRADAVMNGAEAVRALEELPYDLVLMDCQMPEMDGYEATAEIRRREQSTGRHIPIVAMTANAMTGDREKCLDAGMDDYVSKPVNQRDLVEAIKRMLDQTKSTTSDQAVESVLDLEVLNEMCGGDNEFSHEVLQEFLSSSGEIFERLRSSVQEGDPVKVRADAHALKGSSATIGAKDFSATCLRLEEAGKAGELQHAARDFVTAEQAYALLCQTINSIVMERAA